MRNIIKVDHLKKLYIVFIQPKANPAVISKKACLIWPDYRGSTVVRFFRNKEQVYDVAATYLKKLDIL